MNVLASFLFLVVAATGKWGGKTNSPSFLLYQLTQGGIAQAALFCTSASS